MFVHFGVYDSGKPKACAIWEHNLVVAISSDPLFIRWSFPVAITIVLQQQRRDSELVQHAKQRQVLSGARRIAVAFQGSMARRLRKKWVWSKIIICSRFTRTFCSRLQLFCSAHQLWATQIASEKATGRRLMASFYSTCRITGRQPKYPRTRRTAIDARVKVSTKFSQVAH